MFTKNIKTISILALVAVIVLVAAVLIAIGNDSNVSAGADDKINSSIEDVKKDYEDQIAELNKIIDDLKSGLISTEEALAKLEENGIKLDKWNEATLVVIEKAEELENVWDTFSGKYELGFDKYFDNNAEDTFYELQYKAEIDLLRATSVEAMDAIIAGFKADLEAVPTKIDTLRDMIDDIKADGVKFEDLEAIIDAEEYFDAIDDDTFAEGEHDAIAAEIADLYAQVDKAIVEGFVASVNALPEVNALTGSDEHIAALESVNAALTYIINNEIEVADNEDFEAANETFNTLCARMTVISQIVADATRVNALIDAEANTTFGATVEAANTIKALKAAVKAYDEAYDIANCNDWIKALLHRDAFNGYVTAFETATADLKAKAETYIAAVNAFGKIDTTSKEALSALLNKYVEIFGALAPETVDAILGVTAEENSVVVAWNKYLTLKKSYDVLVESIKYVNDNITALVDTDEATVADSFLDIDFKIAFVIGQYELDETVFDATLLAKYKTARLQAYIDAAKANVATVYAANENHPLRDQAKAALEEWIDTVAATSYTFTVKTINLPMQIGQPAQYLYVIDNAATGSVIAQLETFTVEMCTGFFADFN